MDVKKKEEWSVKKGGIQRATREGKHQRNPCTGDDPAYKYERREYGIGVNGMTKEFIGQKRVYGGMGRRA